ncbi:MAG: suppressor of fused domain protein [Planctomycetota bacterium]|jgi:hypothetical protein
MSEIDSEIPEEIEAESSKEGARDAQVSKSSTIGMLSMNRLVAALAGVVLVIAGIAMLIVSGNEGGKTILKEGGLEVREAHYIKYFGPLEEKVMHSTDVKEVHIDIYQFPPNDERPHWTLITSGMSDLPQYVPEDAEGIAPRAEILLYAKEPQNWMFDVLKGLAEMPFERKTYLHWHHTVPNGQAMTADPSELTSFFFLPPYFEDPRFDTLQIDGEEVDILWMIPITEEERAYAIEEGSQALEELFEKAEMDPVIDEKRKSLVLGDN